MPRPAASIIAQANQIAKVGGYTAIALDQLNSLLDHIARTVDLAASTGQWNFTFATNMVSSGGGNIVSAAPNPLPIDYLRVAGSTGSTGAQRSSKWYLNGVPYDMVEIDLTEWDDQVQQAGLQSYPYFWAKDFSTYAPTIEVTGDLTANSTAVANLTAINPSTGTVTGVGTTAAIVAGLSVAGGLGPLVAIPAGATVVSTGGSPPTSLTLSAAATASLTGATLLVGHPGNGYPYPPPSGAFNVMIRYQRLMPRMTQAQVDAGAYCWFPDDMVLVEGLAGLMMQVTDDSRVMEFIGGGLNTGEGRFGKRLVQYRRLADDRANRAATVQLDRRRFGAAFAHLPNTKQIGWLVLLTLGLGGIMGLPLC